MELGTFTMEQISPAKGEEAVLTSVKKRVQSLAKY